MTQKPKQQQQRQKNIQSTTTKQQKQQQTKKSGAQQVLVQQQQKQVQKKNPTQSLTQKLPQPQQQQQQEQQQNVFNMSTRGIKKIIPATPDVLRNINIQYANNNVHSPVAVHIHGERVLEVPEQTIVKMMNHKNNKVVQYRVPEGFSTRAFLVRLKSKNGKRQVLKLNKALYGLCQSPRAFWKYITEKLESCGLKQSKFDPCLFIGPDVMCIVYVDDLIFWSRDVTNIDRVTMELCKLGVALEQEDDAAGFLGVKFDRDNKTGMLETTQTSLIDRVVEALGLDDGYARGKHTPAKTKPLVKDEDGVAAVEGFS
jgi:hypothetical protein